MSLKRAHVHITGRVQGVFYRSWVSENAHRLGLRGWVRNRFDGSVEAIFEGSGDVVAQMVKLCHDGPPHAQVDTVLDDYSEPAEGLASFEVMSSA